MMRWIRLALLAVFGSSSLLSLAAVDDDPLSDPDSSGFEPPAYWNRAEDGWYWYKDPKPAPKPKPRKPKSGERAVDDAGRRKELADMEALQQRVKDLKAIAVMSGDDRDIESYLRLQKYVSAKSRFFADAATRIVWRTPDLDYRLEGGRPTNNTATQVFDEDLSRKQARTIRSLARTHGLFFFFRSDCSYCHKMAPILRRFEQEYGIQVFPISLDGPGLPEYPNPVADNGIAINLNVTTVPAVFLAVPGTREVTPIGYGVLATTDLVERIHLLTQVPVGAAR